MARDADWSVVGMGSDPTPGDPERVEQLADDLTDFAEAAAEAYGTVRDLLNDDAVASFTGEAASAFKNRFDDVPGNLKKLWDSYELAADALATYWPRLADAQTDADRALLDAQEAQADLTSAEDWLERATSAFEDAEEDAEDPDADEVSAEVRRALTEARSQQGDAEDAVSTAQGRLAAAKALAEQAKEAREEAAQTCADGLSTASEAGIQNKSWWQKIIDWVVDNWNAIVEFAKLVVAVLGVVVLIIGGPLAWVVLAAALVVLADSIIKYANGEGSLWDVAFAALDCIPGFKGLTTAAGLLKGFKSGLKGMGSAVTGARQAMEWAGRKIQKLFCRTDPVDMATGQVVMSDTDISLPAVLPLIIERHHRTGVNAGHWFGTAWSSTLDQSLVLDDREVRFVSADGMTLHYALPLGPVPGSYEAVPVTGADWTLSWDGEPHGRMTVDERDSGRLLHFAPVPGYPGRVLPLVAITDRHGNTMDIRYDEAGQPSEISHSGGYRIGVRVSEQRVTALTLLSHPEQPVLAGYGYDHAGNLTRVHNHAGGTLRLSYDEQHRVTGWEAANGGWYSYLYDQHSRCVATDGADGILASAIAYDPERRVTRFTDSHGNQSVYEFSQAYRLVRSRDPLGGVRELTYDRHQHLASVTDEAGHTTRYVNTPAGQPVSVTLPDGATRLADYDDHGRVTSYQEADGARWTRTYDTRGNLSGVTAPDGAATRYAYDRSGALTQLTSPLGDTWQVRNNQAGLPIATTDSQGNTTHYRRDPCGYVCAITDPHGAETRMVWSPGGEMLSLGTPDGAVRTWDYDDERNLAAYTDALGNLTRYETPRFGMPTVVTGPDGRVTRYHYDTEGRLLRVINPLGYQWEYAYDAGGNLCRETDFNGRSVSYRHDPAGRTVLRVNGAGQRITHRYDVRGQLVERAADGAATRYRYDAAGRLLEATAPHATLTYQLDPLGKVLAETCNGRTTRMEYDLLGRRTRRVTPAGCDTNWRYDSENRLTGLSSGPHQVRLAYDAGGREAERLLPGALRLRESWDAASRLTEQRLTRGPDGPDGPARLVRQHDFRYRVDGALNAIHDLGEGTTEFAVDDDGLVTAARGPGGGEDYQHDAVRNLTSGGLPDRYEGDARGYDGMRLTRAGNTRYEYDGQGRAIRAVRRLLSGGKQTWTYRWNAYDQLTGLTTPDGRRWRYLYDPLGRRIAKQRLTADDGVAEETLFSWEGTRVAERQIIRGAGVGEATAWHWQPGTHRPLAQTTRRPAREDTVDERFYSIVTDLVGAPTELYDEQGCLAWRRQQGLWGSRAASGDGTDCPLGFPGQFHDRESGLYYNLSRYYDPDNARYLSPDPLGLDADPNNYAYVPNPLIWSDPLGLACGTDGGWYGGLQPAGSGKEINHMPAKQPYKDLDLTNYSGPAIRMDKPDHRLVTSTGSSKEAKKWRQQQKDLIDQGKFDEAMKMDIDDIRDRFGTKYDAEIKEMVDSLDDNKSLQDLLNSNGWSINKDLLK